ncbi:MAG: redoxin domain-containing protein [Chloroflexi bacterium]|nr:redoxin domain-containing protein [Chloroflexota bacterium]
MPSDEKFEDFKSVVHAGEPAPDFTLPPLDGGEVTLSKLKGKPVMIEFGSIT